MNNKEQLRHAIFTVIDNVPDMIREGNAFSRKKAILTILEYRMEMKHVSDEEKKRIGVKINELFTLMDQMTMKEKEAESFALEFHSVFREDQVEMCAKYLLTLFEENNLIESYGRVIDNYQKDQEEDLDESNPPEMAPEMERYMRRLNEIKEAIKICKELTK